MTNPFEDDDRDYLVLTNDEDQHSLWPADIDAPAGWSRVHGPAPRAECLTYVDRHWQDMRPRSLRDAMAARAAEADADDAG